MPLSTALSQFTCLSVKKKKRQNDSPILKQLSRMHTNCIVDLRLYPCSYIAIQHTDQVHLKIAFFV
ncbi:hypothetical protein ACHAW5_009524 [Stephanodiscus triporus]|uniref:Uncharacterized protein n=1 Tax=Stephanodiscus triporus TaxID=2934178 RepID=A0ABD3NP35_9STRA